MPFSIPDPPELRIKKQKQALRSHHRALRKQISLESRSLLDSALLANLASHPAFERAQTVLFYYPVKGEPNLLPLAQHALHINKAVAFPCSDTEHCTMTFRTVTDLCEMSLGAYDIPEPTEAHPILTDFSDSLCIVPGLAFDFWGYRLGQGKGFYDRFLSNYNGLSIGLSYHYFLL